MHAFTNYANNRLSYPESVMTSLYNKNSNLDNLDITNNEYNEDGSKNYKLIDNTFLGVKN